MMKRLLAAAAAIAVVAALSTSADAQQKVRIGYSVGKTGLLAAACPVQKEAYELWRDQVNEKGGLQVGTQGKRMIEFVEYDDASDAAKAVQITRS
jgi:branched-chain amino acid transport system substrate-binding protein